MEMMHSNTNAHYPRPITWRGYAVRLLAVVVVIMVMAGCHPKWEVDQELRTRLFHECLERIPDGPQQTQYNDWAEVVSECSSSSYYRAMYCVKRCPPPPSKGTP